MSLKETIEFGLINISGCPKCSSCAMAANTLLELFKEYSKSKEVNQDERPISEQIEGS